MNFDYFDIPESQALDFKKFNATGGSFQTWNKPRGKAMCMMVVIGSGSGGGGGMTGATGTVRGGGGGGASGAIARCVIPIFALPDTMYVQVGVGGAGGAAINAGGAGQRSYISLAPNTTAANIIMQSGNAAATGGAAGSVAGSAAAGVAETISTVALCLQANMGIFTFIAGKIGSIGGVVAGGNGSSNTILTTHFLNGGAGGGTTPAANTDFIGGAQTGAGIFPTCSQAAGAGIDGRGSYLFEKPFLSYGGCGGNTHGAGQAGAGANGAIGSGGGGGGGGITGGRGGRGGDGLVLIYCW
jgi:hypothetical protein